ncbi:MAG: hypothetical protein B9S32_13815 [Verrucomicrobia bacterium Tous-C9LFEB]|nr:MAG: hypothetical protein B9S32_13815 [Verrucomicrobia bacterium Tous-C9LFEB]
MTPQSLIAAVAEKELGVHETSPNQGPGIAKYWLATTYPNGMIDRQPWCSAFVSWCVQEADQLSPLLSLPIPPRFPAVAQWRAWALANGCELFTFSDPSYIPMAGDILVLSPKVSHITIIVRDGWQSTPDGRAAATVEGNSNDDGSRDGREVVRHLRHPSRFPAATALRLPARALPA